MPLFPLAHPLVYRTHIALLVGVTYSLTSIADGAGVTPRVRSVAVLDVWGCWVSGAPAAGAVEYDNAHSLCVAV